MYSYQIKEMTTTIAEALNLEKESAKIEEALRQYWNDKIALTWSVEDVQSVCNVDEDKAKDILLEVLASHDAEFGVNWEVIKTCAN